MGIDLRRLSHRFHLQSVQDNSLPFCNNSDWKVVYMTLNRSYALLRIKFVVNKEMEEDHLVDQGLMMMTECKKIRLNSGLIVESWMLR